MNIETIVDEMMFIEAPRWRGEHLWFSDMHDETVYRLKPGEALQAIATVPHSPSGLGWLPNGDLLISSMADRKIMRLSADGELGEHADVSHIAKFHINDMITDSRGRAWVGNFGFLFGQGGSPRATKLARIDPDGSTHIAADDLMFPNGMVVTPDGRTLIVAETFAHKLTAFDVAESGDLSNRRDWANLEGLNPDGICLDQSGAIWIASPTDHAFLRVREGGEILQRIPIGRQAIACTLGGADGRTLFMCSSRAVTREACRAKNSAQIATIRVDVAGTASS